MFRFCDSFDHYGSNQLYAKWTQYSAVGIIPNGRNGAGLALQGNGSISKTLTPQSGWTVGFAWRTGAFFGINNIYTGSAVFVEPGFTGSANMITLQVNSDGTLSFTAGNNIIGTSTKTLHGQTFYYFEVQYTMAGNPIVTTAELRVNGEVWLNAQGNTGVLQGNLLFNQSASNQHTWLGNSLVPTIDDLYINDNQGINNSYFGDVKIGCIYPRQDVTTQWGVSTGTPGDGNNYKLVNEHPPDDDNSYIIDNVPGDVDEFYFDTVTSLVGQILAVQYSIYARKDNEGSRAIKARLNGIDIDPDLYLGDDYLYYCTPFDQNGSIPWSVANINTAKFGVTLTR